jgi:hypothetical protein
MNSLMMLFATLTVGAEGTIYVPRTEVVERTTVVPRIVYDEVKIRDEVTVYDRYETVLVPTGTVRTLPVVERPRVVGKFKYRVSGKVYLPWRRFR